MRISATNSLSPVLMAGRGITASSVASGTTFCTAAVGRPANLYAHADVVTTGALAVSWPTYALTMKHRADAKPGFITATDHRLSRRPLERAP